MATHANTGAEALTSRRRVGLAVVFASLGASERRAIQQAWRAARSLATSWRPAFTAHTTGPLADRAAGRADLLVYLGESSRFDAVAGRFARRRPVLLVKSTMEDLMITAPGAPPRYRMCVGVDGIARMLAEAAPVCPTVDWRTLPWPPAVAAGASLDASEERYVEASLEAFYGAAARRRIRRQKGLPPRNGPFTVFLTMHDPLASRLAAAALGLWPQCTVLTADGMVSERAPDGAAWPGRLYRVRHWSPSARSQANRTLRTVVAGGALPVYDTAGLLFGTMAWLDAAFAKGVPAGALEKAPAGPGPLGPLRFGADGKPVPGRLIVGPAGGRLRAS